MEEAIARPAAVEEGAFKTFTFEEGLVNRSSTMPATAPTSSR